MALPFVLLHFLNKRLANIPSYYGHAEGLDLALIRGAYRIENVFLDRVDPTTQERTPFIGAGSIDLSVEWKALFHGALVGELVIERPLVHFTKDKVEPAQVQRDTTSLGDLLKDLMPLQINRVEAHRGEIHYIDPTSSPKVDVKMDAVELLALNLRNSYDPTVVLPASLRADAHVYGGTFVLNMRLNPLERDPTFDLDVSMTDMQLPLFNDFFQAYANVDVNKGTFGLYAEIATKERQFAGYVKPIIHDLDVLDPEDRDDTFFRKLWEGIVGTVGAGVYPSQRTAPLSRWNKRTTGALSLKRCVRRTSRMWIIAGRRVPEAEDPGEIGNYFIGDPSKPSSSLMSMPCVSSMSGIMETNTGMARVMSFTLCGVRRLPSAFTLVNGLRSNHGPVRASYLQNQHTMKTLKKSLRSLLLAGTVLVVPLAMAQDKSGDHARKSGNPEARVERMTKELGLNAGQSAKIKTLAEKNQERMTVIRAIEDADERRKQMRENHQAMRKAIQSVLTPEQQAKADALRAERKAQRGDGKGSWNANPEKRAEARTEWMTKELGLSTEQAAKVKAIHLQHIQKYEGIKAMEDAEQRKTAMTEVRKSQQEAVQAVLTPAQQKRLQEIKAERKAKHEQRKADGERKGKGGDGKGREWKEKK